MIKIKIDYDSGRKKGIITSDYLQNIREYFSVEDKTSKFKNRYSVGFKMPTRIYAITPQGRFEPRMYNVILDYLKSLDTPLEIEITDDFKDVIKTPIVKSELHRLNLELRDYQRASIESALKEGFGTIILPTSAGKTLVIATLIKTIQNNFKAQALIIVPNIGLLEQTYNDFIEYGIDPSELEKWTGGEAPKANIIITNTQILLSDIQDILWLTNIELLVCDECHKFKKANKINDIVAKIPARLRFGFTGTLPNTKIDVWTIFGIFGNIIYQKTSEELRSRKQISPVIVSALKIHYNGSYNFKRPSNDNPTEAYEDEIQFLQNNKFRNDIIVKLVNRVDKNILIMVDRIIHGEILLDILQKNTKKQIYFVQGSVEVEDRKKIIALMEANDDIVCIAISAIFSTGVNIKNLHYVIFAAIGKSKIKLIQSVGRSLRLHASKVMAYIFDIADMLRYGSNHYTERIELYANEKITVKETILNEPACNKFNL